MFRIIQNKKAEGYIDVCVGVVVFAMVLVIAINIFSFTPLFPSSTLDASDLGGLIVRCHVCLPFYALREVLRASILAGGSGWCAIPSSSG